MTTPLVICGEGRGGNNSTILLGKHLFLSLTAPPPSAETVASASLGDNQDVCSSEIITDSKVGYSLTGPHINPFKAVLECFCPLAR